jgi:hypothetical protein
VYYDPTPTKEFNHAIEMAQMGRAEGYEEETSSDDDLEIIGTVRRGPRDTDKYIESEWS